MSSFLQQILRVRGELFWVITGHAASFVGGLIGIKILTRLLGPVGYGRLALGLTIAGILTTFLHNPLSNAVARFYVPYRDSGRELLYYVTTRSLHLKLIKILLPVVMVIAVLVGLVVNRGWGLLVAVGLFFGLANGIWVSFLAWQNATRDRRGATTGQIGDVWLRIGIAILLSMIWRTGEVALLGYVLGTTLVLVWQNKLVRTKEQQLQGPDLQLPGQRLVGETGREFVRFSLPFAGYAVFTSLTLYADRWILQGVGGAEAVGIYAVMCQLAGSPVNIMFAVINQMFVPIVYERAGCAMETKNHQNIRRLLHNLVGGGLLVLLALVAVLYFWCGELARLFTTPVFATHAKLIPLLVLSMGLFHLGQLYTLEGNSLHRPGAYYLPKILHACVLTGAGVLLTLRFGAFGMAWASVLASGVYLVFIPLINMRLKYL